MTWREDFEAQARLEAETLELDSGAEAEWARETRAIRLFAEALVEEMKQPESDYCGHEADAGSIYGCKNFDEHIDRLWSEAKKKAGG